MKKTGPAPKPTFFWQGLLIVLPVLVLAGFGVYSLRLDREKAEQEAVEQAKVLAENLADAYSQELTNFAGADAVTFTMDSDANLLNPRPWQPIPEPRPLDVSKLTPDMAVLWSKANTASVQETNLTQVTSCWRAFIAQKPPPEFEAIALYRLGMACRDVNWRSVRAQLEAMQGKELTLPDGSRAVTWANFLPPGAFGTLTKAYASPEATEAFEEIVRRFPDALTESGLPLLPLAELHWIEGMKTGVLTSESSIRRSQELSNLITKVVEAPSVLTPDLLCSVLELAGYSPGLPELLDRLWIEQETGRALHRVLRDESFLKSKGGVRTPGWYWLRDSSYAARRSWKERCYAVYPGRNPSGVAFPSTVSWLARPTMNKSNQVQVVCRPKLTGEAFRPSHQLLERCGLPAYASLSFSIAGKPLGHSGEPYYFERVKNTPLMKTPQPGAKNMNVLSGTSNPATYWRANTGFAPGLVDNSPAPKLLATASRLEEGMEFLRVNIHLGHPHLLYQAVRTRTLWLGLLIGTAALAAFIGWLAAWRAFHRQQQLAELKTNFVSSVSHELRAPIASVRLMAEGLERGKIQESSKQHQYFRFIVQECRRLSSLVENVLDFSRIEQGRKEYELEPTDLRILVQQTASLLAASAEERQVKLCSELPEKAVVSEVDGRAMQQALVNLIDNALKHSPPGAIVQVGLSLSDPSDKSDSKLNVLHLWVQDQGPGIPPEEHQRIFERFYRRGSELRRETQGVGIGLSIVKHIVEAHGGKVLVQSAPGQGSRFTIELKMTANHEHE